MLFKRVRSLSGGERGRLALAMLARQGANFLLLDQPTNHLDLPAQEVLQEVLDQYEGTILLISHDRYLVSHLATQIWDLRDGYLNVFDGDYQDFVAQAEIPASGNSVRWPWRWLNGYRRRKYIDYSPTPTLRLSRRTKITFTALHTLQPDRLQGVFQIKPLVV